MSNSLGNKYKVRDSEIESHIRRFGPFVVSALAERFGLTVQRMRERLKLIGSVRVVKKTGRAAWWGAALLLVAIASGCASGYAGHIDRDDAVEHIILDDGDSHSDANIDQSDSTGVPESNVAFAMDASQFATLASYLGDGNTLTLEKPVQLKKDNATLEAKAGTRVSYEMTDTAGVFTFEKPYPVIKASLAKLIGGTSLHSITIRPDGTGTAKTGLGSYGFRWADDGSGSSQSSPPSTRCNCGCGQDGCACGRASSAALPAQAGARCSPQSPDPFAPPPELSQIGSKPIQFKRAENRQRSQYGVMITADWCPPCLTVKNKELPKLEKSTWLINKGPQSNLLVLDYDNDSTAVESLKAMPHRAGVKQPTSLPAFVRVENGEVTAIHEGAMDAAQIARFVYPSLVAAGANQSKPVAGGPAVCPRCGKVH